MEHFVLIGGTSGIGQGIAENLNAKGARITTISRRADGLDGCEHIPHDILEETFPADQVTGPIHGIAYCPGSINLRPFRSLKTKDFANDWKINVMGAVSSIKALLPLIDQRKGAGILLFSTVAVQQGMPFHASVAASKGAIEGLTRSLAAELAPDIRVNCIAPSLTDTPMAARLLSNTTRAETSAARHPLQRVGTVEDIAAMGAFLLGAESSWISGQIYGIDGGMSALRIS